MTSSVDAGFILVLSFHHLEPECIGVSTKGGLMYRIEIPLQDFTLKMQGYLCTRGGLCMRGGGRICGTLPQNGIDASVSLYMIVRAGD